MSYKHIGSMVSFVVEEVYIILTKTHALVVESDNLHDNNYNTMCTSAVNNSWDIHINENDMVACLYEE